MPFSERDLGSLLWVAIVIPLVALWIAVFWDLAKRSDLALVRKTAWGVVIVATAYVGIAAYFAMRPISMPRGKSTTQSVPRASAVVHEIETLSEANKSGALSESDYTVRKRELFGLKPTPR